MTLYTKTIRFCAGHRVLHTGSRCASFHGHDYVLSVAVETQGYDVFVCSVAPALDAWIAANWDRGFLVDRDDAEAVTALQSIDGQKLFRLPGAPTIENMSRYFLDVIGPHVLAGTGSRIIRAVVLESESRSAEATVPKPISVPENQLIGLA